LARAFGNCKPTEEKEIETIMGRGYERIGRNCLDWNKVPGGYCTFSDSLALSEIDERGILDYALQQ
jgi:hypothetical protein